MSRRTSQSATNRAWLWSCGTGRPGRGKVTFGVGTIEVRAPRVNDRRLDEDGGRQRFTSEILPPYMRRSPNVAEVLPILYLRGLSTGDFRPALEGLLGKDAAGLSATNIVRLTVEWDEEYQLFRKGTLAEKDTSTFGMTGSTLQRAAGGRPAVHAGDDRDHGTRGRTGRKSSASAVNSTSQYATSATTRGALRAPASFGFCFSSTDFFTRR